MKMANQYFYVLYCQDDTLYAGYTNNLEQRLLKHNSGKGAKYTRPDFRRPVHMIYAEEWETKSQAMRAEAKFKQLTRAQKEMYLHSSGVESLQGKLLYYVDRTDSLCDKEDD